MPAHAMTPQSQTVTATLAPSSVQQRQTISPMEQRNSMDRKNYLQPSARQLQETSTSVVVKQPQQLSQNMNAATAYGNLLTVPSVTAVKSSRAPSPMQPLQLNRFQFSATAAPVTTVHATTVQQAHRQQSARQPIDVRSQSAAQMRFHSPFSVQPWRFAQPRFQSPRRFLTPGPQSVRT